MPHPEYDARSLNSIIHLQAILDARRHRFLAQDMIPLLRERTHDLEVHAVLNGDDNCIREAAPAGRTDRLRRGRVEIAPGAEDERVAERVRNRDMLPRLGSRLGDSNDSAARRVREREFCVVLPALARPDDHKRDWPSGLISVRHAGTVGAGGNRSVEGRVRGEGLEEFAPKRIFNQIDRQKAVGVVPQACMSISWAIC